MKIFGRPLTIVFIVVFFAVIGAGVIILNWLSDLNIEETYFLGTLEIIVGYGIWNFKKWAGILGIILSIIVVITSSLMDIMYGGASFVSVILNNKERILIMYFIVLNWNNLHPKSLIEFFNPIKRWINGGRKI